MSKQTTSRAILAGNLRRLREAEGLSQERLAEVAGFHRTYVSQIEREQSNITIDNLERLAETLGVSTSLLLSEPEKTASGTR